MASDLVLGTQESSGYRKVPGFFRQIQARKASTWGTVVQWCFLCVFPPSKEVHMEQGKWNLRLAIRACTTKNITRKHGLFTNTNWKVLLYVFWMGNQEPTRISVDSRPISKIVLFFCCTRDDATKATIFFQIGNSVTQLGSDHSRSGFHLELKMRVLNFRHRRLTLEKGRITTKENPVCPNDFCRFCW